MAALYNTNGARFVTLLNQLQSSRDALNRTLQALIQQGWISRNPGYGHPLRPEYLLTSHGLKIAPVCDDLCDCLRGLNILDIGFNKWLIPVVVSLGLGHYRFNEIKLSLENITPVALATTLKLLSNRQLIVRNVSADSPPQVKYRPSSELAALTQSLLELHSRL